MDLRTRILALFLGLSVAPIVALGVLGYLRSMDAVEALVRTQAEIRNPLTSIKLNLQDLDRDVEAGVLPETAARPVEICLREARRLDGAVRRVLETASTHPPDRVRVPVHVVLDDALALMEPQFWAQGVGIRRRFEAGRDEDHGGRLDLEAADGVGALFVLELPLEEGPS